MSEAIDSNESPSSVKVVHQDPRLITHLTPRQEEKLRSYLDEKLSNLESDERTHKLGPLPRLLSRLSPLLQVILQIPPFYPFGSLRTSYLLTLTSVIPIYITSLPLLSSGHRTKDEAQDEASCVIRDVLDLLKELEKGWLAVLKGDGWIPPHSTGGTQMDVTIGGKAVKVDDESKSQVAITEKIRLKSIILSSRARVLAWARPYGNFDKSGSALPNESDGTTPIPEMQEDVVVATNSGGWEEEILSMWDQLQDVLSHDLSQSHVPIGRKVGNSAGG
ncbi:hypothetical protein I203_101220 [Kwoniella mangroviensis CBS 8507]|uniref:uncharacterized protein n=1 Tax=Kwoniella mangroviensis CBS 8507 TaxID=1296122 RepID=UPI00080CF665|nr:uncharacterized protein I203_02856 [Kwoniella mangroviensis CBS 8507]OCF68193.1 hypothetical protein I203_02856 [Kwoniella mangroviensis CBS 8507]